MAQHRGVIQEDCWHGVVAETTSGARVRCVQPSADNEHVCRAAKGPTKRQDLLDRRHEFTYCVVSGAFGAHAYIR